MTRIKVIIILITMKMQMQIARRINYLLLHGKIIKNSNLFLTQNVQILLPHPLLISYRNKKPTKRESLRMQRG